MPLPEFTMYNEILQLASTAARTAGNLARTQAHSLKVSLKSADQLVTQIDRQCQDLIVEQVRSRFPDHGFIAEEGDHGHMFKIPPSGSDDFWWVIDPIDGTRNFVHEFPLYAVSIGVLHKGIPVVGVIYEPNLDLLFTAHKDGPALCNDRPIRCTDEPLHKNSQLAISGNISLHLSGSCLSQTMKKHVLVNLGSAALHYAFIARGSFTAAFGWEIKLWDIAGGSAICLAAGASVLAPDGSPIFPLDCSSYQGQPLPILIAPPSLHTPLHNLFSLK